MPGFSGALWPNHPHRLPDELLSFWALRVAHANRIKLQTFTSVTFGRNASPWARDIDRSATPEFLATLSVRTGAPLEELKAGMLTGYEGILFEHHTPNGNTPWILPLGVYHRTRTSFGVQYCPECLFWDEEPYFRRRWRLSLATICDQHGTLLHDRCPGCGAPVIYFRNDLGRRKDWLMGNHASCWRCGFDYRRAPRYAADWADWKSYLALRGLLTFIDSGIGVAGDHYFQYSLSFISVLHRVCEIFASVGKSRKYDRLQEVVRRQLGIWPLHLVSRGHFEAYSVLERHRILLSALWLLMEWPDRFTSVCREAGVFRSLVMGDTKDLPYWFDSVLKRELDRSSYRITAVEAGSAAASLGRRGVPVTRAAIGRATGRNCEGLTGVSKRVMVVRWPLSAEQCSHLLDILGVRIVAAPKGSLKRWLLERDRVILLIMRETTWPIRQVLDLTVDGALAWLNELGDVANCLKWPVLHYIHVVRPRLGITTTHQKLFVGYRHEELGTENMAVRFRSLLRTRSP